MKTIVIYNSKYGSTQKAAQSLATKLNALLVNIKENEPDISDCDMIILGSNVRYGQVNNAIKKFIHKNKTALLNKKFALFVCSAMQGTGEKYFKENFSADILDKAVATANLGGEINKNTLVGFDKFLMKIIGKNAGTPAIDEDAITEFANKIISTEG